MFIVSTQSKKCDLTTNVTRGLTLESRYSPLMTAATAPMSVPDQLLHLLGVIPLLSNVAESESPLLTSGIQRVTDAISLLNMATLAVGAVFHLSSPCLAMNSSPRPRAAKQHQQLATALTSLPFSSSIPPFQPRVTLTPTTLWRTLAVWGTGIETLSWG